MSGRSERVDVVGAVVSPSAFVDSVGDTEMWVTAQTTRARADVICYGCGQSSSDDTGPLEAAARTLPRRFAALLDYSDEALRRRATPVSPSALDYAACAADTLAAADWRLRQRLNGDLAESTPVIVPAPPACAGLSGTMAVLDFLSQSAIGLARTLDAATIEDWQRANSGRGVSAARQVWLDLHDATHHLEDAERTLQAPFATAATFPSGPVDQGPDISTVVWLDGRSRSGRRTLPPRDSPG